MSSSIEAGSCGQMLEEVKILATRLVKARQKRGKPLHMAPQVNNARSQFQ
ncbi:unnamed protein product [Prunus armeniaca]